MEGDNWPVWARQLAYGPYPCSCSYEHSADVLTEAARFVPESRTEQRGLPAAASSRP
jgi:hypothetical protein